MELVVIEIRKDVIEHLMESKAISSDDIVFLSEHNVSDSQQRTADLKMIAAIQKEARDKYRLEMIKIEKIENSWKQEL